MIRKSVLLSAFLLWSSGSFAAEVILLQTGKTFVRNIDEAKAKEIADNHDEVKRYSFDELKIKQGDTIEFRNVDSVKHNVFLDEVFNFVQPSGSKDKFVFSKKGTYEVRCAIHPKMKIKIVVE